MRLESPTAGGGEKSASLIGIEGQRALQHRPRRAEQEEGSGEVDEEVAARCDVAPGDLFFHDHPQVVVRRSEGGLEHLDRHFAAVGEITEEEARLGGPSRNPVDDSFENLGNCRRGRFIMGGLVFEAEIGQRPGRAPQDRPIELLLAPEMVGHGSGIGPREVADPAHRCTAIAVIGEKRGGCLEKTSFCVQIHTVVCIKSMSIRQYFRFIVGPVMPLGAIVCSVLFF